MIGTRQQIELTHRRSHQTLTFVLQFAKLPYLSDAHIGIADDLRAVTGESLLLNISRGLYSGAYRFARLPQPIPAQLFIIHARNFDVNVNSIK